MSSAFSLFVAISCGSDSSEGMRAASGRRKGRRDSDERSMESHACVVTGGREEEVRCATWDAVGEVTGYKPVKESAILWPALVSEREVRKSSEGAVPVSMSAGHFPIESKGSFRYGGFSPAVGCVPGHRE
jgi:hypothetical protein